MIKDISLAFTLDASTLFAESKMIAEESLRFFEPCLVEELMYWAAIIFIAVCKTWLEKKLNHSL
ncbi:MAG: hypothetical protein ACSLEL_00290 [Candidatus Malihini olakiniferum]